MIKKIFFILITAASLMFFSCGSTKPEEAPKPAEPIVTEETQNTKEVVETQPEQEAQNVQILEADTKEDESEIEAGAGTEVGAEADVDTDAETETEAQSEIQDGQTSEQDDETSETYDSEETTTESQTEELYKEYPALEEIDEPSLIELTLEEIEKNAQKEKPAEEISEPVTEIEELPPLTENDEDHQQEEADGLDEMSDDSTGDSEAVDLDDEQEEQTAEEIVIVPSRSVSLKKGETLSITYPGSGWIYMGSTSEYNNLASRGRKLGTTDTKYTLLAKEPGTQIHHFYKIDNLTGEYIDDYIEVTVLDKKGSASTIVEAPEYKEAVPKKPETPAKSIATKQKEAQESLEQQEKAQEQSQTTTTTQEKKPVTSSKTEKPVETEKSDDVVIVVDEDDSIVVVEEEEEEEQIIDLSGLIEEAQAAIKSKKYGDAYTALSKYLEYSTDGRDEALYLMGQILESDSKFRNIKEAVNTYQTLCDNYPASEYWDKANKRIIYLKRFYINIH
ncbi:MAG: hypothetical protein J6X78_12525 [Treponema sp.]|nr:hypothetical protein [Treponema sp.]